MIYCVDVIVDVGQVCFIKGVFGQGKLIMMVMIGGLFLVMSGYIIIVYGYGDCDFEQVCCEGLVVYVFQYLFFILYFIVWENVVLCVEVEIVYQLLVFCGMVDLVNQQVSMLFGGQQQWVVVVWVVVLWFVVLLVDELMVFFDDDNWWVVEKLFQDYLDDGGMIIMVLY